MEVTVTDNIDDHLINPTEYLLSIFEDNSGRYFAKVRWAEEGRAARPQNVRLLGNVPETAVYAIESFLTVGCLIHTHESQRKRSDFGL